jgi:SpoVK/Ycf46/Vps4 family AAA+-type ATPase
MMRQETFRPVLERLLATRRSKVEDTQSGARRGMRVLFTGPSGKDRLLAAQLFAHELSVDLYQIELDRIVSKRVADTEKNLDALFQAAEASDAVLLFDDTDHLFADAASEESGRFPNLNIAQLRQRLEAYDGVVLLCADERTQIDPKFTRQCDEVVELAED